MMAENKLNLTSVLLVVISFVVFVCLLLLVIFLITKKKKGKKEPKIDDVFMDFIILNYGGIENITNVEVENSRLKITVDDLNKDNLDNLKTQAESGIFVTGNTIKTLYSLSSLKIQKALEGRLKQNG